MYKKVDYLMLKTQLLHVNTQYIVVFRNKICFFYTLNSQLFGPWEKRVFYTLISERFCTLMSEHPVQGVHKKVGHFGGPKKK